MPYHNGRPYICYEVEPAADDADDEPLAELRRALETHERSLVEGARVRVRLSAECEDYWEERPKGSIRIAGHQTRCQGVTGVVTEIHDADTDSHPYLVEFDQPPVIDVYGYTLGGMYAAAELEPIEDPATGTAGGGEEDEGR